MALGIMQKALIDANLAKQPKERKYKNKEFECRKCKKGTMSIIEGTNTMACDSCNNIYVFDRK